MIRLRVTWGALIDGLAGRPGLVIGVLVLVIATAAQTLPPPAELGSRILTDHGDPGLLMWQLTTQSHALLAGRPQDLLQGNIFYPHRDALAYSDALISYLPLFTPVLWASGNPVLSYNLTLFVGYLAGAGAMYALARHLLGAGWAPLLAAVLFSLGTLRSSLVDHLQLVGIAFVLLAVLLLVRTLEEWRWRDALLLGACAGLTWLGTAYGAMMLAIGLPVFFLAWVVVRRGAVDLRAWSRLPAAVLVALALAAPTLPAYLAVQRAGSETRADATIQGITPASLAMLPASPLYRALGLGRVAMPEQDALFPGLLVLALCACLAWSLVHRGSREARPRARVSGSLRARGRDFVWPLVAMVAVEAAVMVGPGALFPFSLPDRALRAVVPGMVSVRGLGRFGLLGAAALAMAGALGAARLFGGRRWAGAAMLALVALAPLETLDAQHVVGFSLSGPRVEANRVLVGLPPGVVMEEPAVQPDWTRPETLGPRMVRSTIDRLPRVDGRSGTVPDDVTALMSAARAFPAPAAVDMMRGAGVRYVVLHGGSKPCADVYGPVEMEDLLVTLAASPAVQSLVDAGPDRVVVLRPLTRAEPAAASYRGPLPERPAVTCADP